MAIEFVWMSEIGTRNASCFGELNSGRCASRAAMIVVSRADIASIPWDVLRSKAERRIENKLTPHKQR